MERSMTISYMIGTKLYMNITNKCPCNCTFCIRNNGDGAYGSDTLWLEHEPSVREIKNNIDTRELERYEEIVFCGYGEPTMRLDTLTEVAEYVRSKDGCPPLRLNTNGLSDLINGRPTASRLCDLFDVISISLNAGTAGEYYKVTRPSFDNAFEAMQKFTSDCVRTHRADVVMTVVDVISESETEAARKMCESLGARLRIRKYEG